MWTVFDYHKLIHFLDNKFPNCLIHGQYADGYSPFIFKYTQEQISNLESICTTNIYNNNLLFQSFIDGTIVSAKQSWNNKIALNKFFTYNDEIDNTRKSNLREYIPALEDLRLRIDNV